jgi:hypothetical protein
MTQTKKGFVFNLLKTSTTFLATPPNDILTIPGVELFLTREIEGEAEISIAAPPISTGYFFKTGL